MYRAGNCVPGEPKPRKPAKPATLSAIGRRRERKRKLRVRWYRSPRPRARAWAVADVDTFRGEEGAGNAVWNEKGREERRHGGPNWIANADENSR